MSPRLHGRRILCANKAGRCRVFPHCDCHSSHHAMRVKNAFSHTSAVSGVVDETSCNHSDKQNKKALLCRIVFCHVWGRIAPSHCAQRSLFWAAGTLWPNCNSPNVELAFLFFLPALLLSWPCITWNVSLFALLPDAYWWFHGFVASLRESAHGLIRGLCRFICYCISPLITLSQCRKEAKQGCYLRQSTGARQSLRTRCIS